MEANRVREIIERWAAGVRTRDIEAIVTIGLEKCDGEWIVVHEHHSQPLDFDANRITAGAA